MERKRIIVITQEESLYIQTVFRVSKTTVWQAVKYVKDNDIHKRIRKFAIDRGNPQMVLASEFDTIFLMNREDADKKMTRYMVQTFENGATLEGNLNDGIIVVRDKRGNVVYVNEDPHISELKAIQEVAMSL